MQVTAVNTSTHAVSPATITNAQGYFRTPTLPPGTYQICVSGKGFASTCDSQTIPLVGPVAILNHVVQIRPEVRAIIGTVTLADLRTPCFWFRPAVSPNALTAKASLLNADNKPIAGPVSGNAAGQFVLPIPETADRQRLHVECDGGVVETAVATNQGILLQDIAMPAGRPVILGIDFSLNKVGVRRADPGATITATVLAKDPQGNQLHYAWFDDSGRTLNLPDAPSVQWPLLSAATTNTIHVQVSNGKGGITDLNRSIQTGPDAIFFSGQAINRQTNAGLPGATIAINGGQTTTDANGFFKLTVADAQQFVLNANHPGFALASLVLRNQIFGIQVPLDPVQTATVNGATGGTVRVPPGSATPCPCKCDGSSGGDDERFHILVEIPETRIDIRHGEESKPAGRGGACPAPPASDNDATITFPTGAFTTAAGVAYTGTVTVEAFQYDLTRPNPIPGDLGGVLQGKPVTLGSFGALYLAPQDAQGNPLAMAAGKQASISMPIQAGQRAAAPVTIPLFHYDEASGLWLDAGTLTRSGTRYTGQITHFSVFNADTAFSNTACVKVHLSGFTMPVTLDGTYFDPIVGSFHHNGFSTSDVDIGIERLAPNQIFTFTVTDSATPPGVVSAALNSGPVVSLPGGINNNFSSCNGPVEVDNITLKSILASGTPYFLGPVFQSGGSTDNSASYKLATVDSQRDTLPHWKQTNGFTASAPTPAGRFCAAPNSGEACGLYFNNGDLKFGRDMHCRVKDSSGATACYVSNFGSAGQDDAPAALNAAETYENSGQLSGTPAATVTMEYDPNPSHKLFGVQFWAYDSAGGYLAKPTLDDQGAKPIPDICLACHQGSYTPTNPTTDSTTVAQGATFLPFDLDSFLDDQGKTFPTSVGTFVPAQQPSFHALNNIIAGIPGPGIATTSAIAELVQPTFWYSRTVTSTPFTFNQGAVQLPGAPFAGHEPLYDATVKVVCRTCHVAIPDSQGQLQWDKFSQMSGGIATFIQSFACGPTQPVSPMPHAEVPWLRFWTQGLGTPLAGELGLNACLPPP